MRPLCYRHILALMSVIFTTGAYAQISMRVEMDRDRYVRYEPIKVKIGIKNFAGHSLQFKNGGYLDFDIKNLNGSPVARGDKFDVVSGLILPAGAMKSVQVQINDFFDLARDGNYELQVRVGHRRLSNDFLSEPVKFEVRDGTTLWEQTVGVPSISSQGKIPVRTCRVVMFDDGDGDIYIFKLEDENYVHAIQRLGARVQGMKPQCSIDALSRIHTLLQSAPRQFEYTVFDIFGKVKTDKTYVVTETTPRLITDPEIGRVMVLGGREAIDGVDFNVRLDDTAAAPQAP